MSTSLAQQLQRLTVPQTTVLKRDKKKASLLFEPKEAAGIKRETFYQIGLEGLEDLIEKNAVFEQFRDTLFSVVSREFERSVQTTEANKLLDKNIKKFLLLLAPYFLINSSHKALEWLIHRYMINEYNREELLMLILPFHETNIFVRVVQLLQFKDRNDPWYFLKSLQKPGVHLTKNALLNHASTNSMFLKFIGKYISNLLKVHDKPNLLAVSFNFYCVVYTGTIECSNKITEDQISQMLPCLIKGLASHIADYCAASYVIVARLVAKTALIDKILDAIVEKISNLNCPTLKTESCLVLLVLYQSQEKYKKIPRKAIENFAENQSWLTKELQNLNSNGSYIYSFLEHLVYDSITYCLEPDSKAVPEMINKMLADLKLDDAFVSMFLYAVLDPLDASFEYPEETKNWLTEIVQTVERQYPSPFDKAVYKVMSGGHENPMKKRKKCLHKILENTMTYKGKFELIENLCHSNEECRSQAIVYLKKNFNCFNETDKEVIKNILIDRLNDDNYRVVRKTLEIVESNSKIFDEREIKSVLGNLAKKCLAGSLKKVTENVLSLLISLPDASSDWEIFMIIFPYLLIVSKEEGVRDLLIRYVSNHKILKGCEDKLKETAEFTDVILKTLQNSNDMDNVWNLINTLSKVSNEKRDALHIYTASVIMTSVLPRKSSIETCKLVLEILSTYLDGEIEVFRGNNSTVAENVEIALQNKLPLQGFVRCIESLVYKTQVPFNLGVLNFLDVDYFILIANIIFQDEKVVLQVLDHFCGSLQEKVKFILNMCASDHALFKRDCKNAALKTVLSLLDGEDETNVKILNDINRLVVPYLITMLSSVDDSVRRLSADIVNLLVAPSQKKTDSYFTLLEGIHKHREEIVLDNEQTPLIMFNILAPENTKGKKNMRELSAIRNRLFKIICDADNYPPYLHSGILVALSHINTFEIFEDVAVRAIDILKSKKGASLNEFDSIVVARTLARIEQRVAKRIAPDTKIWELIELALKDENTVVTTAGKKMCPATLALAQLEEDIFSSLNEDAVKNLLTVVVEISTLSHNPEVLPASSRIFKHIELDARLILDLLVNMKEVQSPKLDGSKKKRRVSVVPTVDILDTAEWKRGVTVLEFIQEKKKLVHPSVLLPILFDVLKKCLDFDEQAAVEYPKQLILSLILHCCSKIEDGDDGLPENVFNMELIVQCIRASQNPQTHHHALLVLAHTAQLIPTQVLHHIMAIFTFMGSSVLRHDDAYSFQIISKIIDTVIPILVKDNCEASICKVLRVFVDALLDVPEHRRLPLYKQLLTRIDAKENLHLFLLLVFESHVMHSAEIKGAERMPRRLDIAAGLSREFSPQIVIHSCIKLIKYLKELPDEKDDQMETDCATFSTANHTPKQFRHYKYTLLTFTSTLLASKEFVDRIAELGDEDLLSLEGLYKEAIIHVLTYIQRVSKVAEKNANTPQAQYWKVVLHHSYDILDSVNALLTPQMFLLVFKGLMVHNIGTVRRRALELLNTKLQYSPTFFSDCSKKEIYALIPPILSILESLEKGLDSEQELIVQTALLSVKLLTKAFAQDEPERFVKILDFITTLVKSGKAQNNVQASVVLCLAELCSNLRAHAISDLHSFMPALLKILKSQKRQETASLLLLSVITAIDKILDSLPLFISPFLQKLLFELCVLTSGSSAEEQKIQPKLTMIRQKIGSVIPSRVLIPAIERCYDDLIEKRQFNALAFLMDVLGENLTNLKGPEINSNLPELTTFFLNALQFRSTGVCSLEEANAIEGHIIKSLTVLILKLSESNFRPLYYKLFDWATRNEVKSDRVITFYSLSNGIAESLKGLFVLFAGHFLNNAAHLLDACNKLENEQLYFEDDNKNVLLLESILKTLHTVFLYDNQKFANKDRFEFLMQPIVDQLENTLGGIEALAERNREVVTPCIVQFALATADDSLWKRMNYQILLKMRNVSADIRLVALHCLTALVKKLGEDFLPLLPETIPFLAELLEDEEENVEKASKKAVQEMEKVLGEPLQKYF